MKYIFYFALTLWIFVSASCSNTRYLPANEQLYTGAQVKIEPHDTHNKKHIKGELEKVLRPKPNGSFLGIRPGLWLYNIAGKNADKGFRKWLKKIGEPPVYLSAVDPFLTSDLMKDKLDNMGYFKSRVDHEVISKRNKASIVYTAKVSRPYKLDMIEYPSEDDSLSIDIRTSRNNALIWKGQQYDLNLLKAERARIDTELKNEGFFFFNPDFLIYKVDTTPGDRLINMSVDVKPDVPEKAKTIYTLNKIYVVPQAQNIRRRLYERDTIYDLGYYFVERMNNIRHKALARNIKIRENEKYSKTDHDLTVSRLMGMGVFKYVSIDYNDTIIDGKGYLDAVIKVTRLLPKTLKVDLDLGSKNNNYSGPSMTVSFTNRNLWKGSELLKFNLNGAYEVQLSGDQKGFNSWELGAGIQLTTPKFLAPFKIRHESSYHIPKTKFDFQFTALHRVQYFDMNGFNFTYGYIWKESETKEYQVNPVAVNYSKLRNTTAKFDSVLTSNPYLKRTFEEQFTFGSTASFTLNTLTGIVKRDQYYLNIMLDLSGNTTSLLKKIGTGEKPSEERPYTLLGSRFSQYSKLSTDFRYYNNFDKNNTLATRIIAGAGIPYGNSTVMPYSKQFFSGGANSVRAFLPRSLGPGSYRPPDTVISGFFDQSGDIRLELNAEFRFTIVSILKGAVFADAGNVWLANRNEFLPGGEFDSKRFLKEVAVGAGLGLRVDLSFFLIRLDVAIPLRKPYLPENERWVAGKIDFGDRQWRRDNLVYNIAVGYPF